MTNSTSVKYNRKVNKVKCKKKCFSFSQTRTSVDTGNFLKQTIMRGCSDVFPKQLDGNLIKQFENGTVTEKCGEVTETTKINGKMYNNTNDMCGHVCETSFCNTDFPGAGGLST